MRHHLISVAAALALITSGCAGIGGSVHGSHKAHVFGEAVYPNGNPPAAAVVIGPTLWDGPHSTNMPLHPEPGPDGVGWKIRIPRRGEGKVDYLAFPCGPLMGKTDFLLDYELTIVGGGMVSATPQPEMGDTGDGYRARITDFFQEDGDDWSASGVYEPMRQYFDVGEDLHYLIEGAHTIVAPLAGPGWGGTQTSTFENNPAGFNKAKANTYACGIVLGGNGIGIGHGADLMGGDPDGYAELWIKRFEVR